MTGGRQVAPNTRDLPPAPDGFSEAEVAAFAQRAIDIAERGVSPQLHGKTPQEAFEFVFATQYPATTEQARSSSVEAAGRYDWEWSWASLFAHPPVEPARYLSARWQVDTEPGTLDDGTTAPQLVVVLDTYVEHLVPVEGDAAEGTREMSDSAPGAKPDQEAAEPVVMHRAIIVRGFRPLGGPAWWPGVGVQAEPLLGGKCAPVNGSLLTASLDPSIIRDDLWSLRSGLAGPKGVNTTAASQAEDIGEYVRRYCRR